MTKNKNILLWSLFIVFYPVIIFFWRIPVFIFKAKSWNLAIAFIDSIISFYKSFKVTFITASFFLVSSAVILWFYNTLFLWLGIVVLAAILLLVYLQRIAQMLRPSSIYQVYNNIFSAAGKNLRSNRTEKEDEDITALSVENMDETRLKKWVTNVEQLVLFNRICIFAARKLKSYQDSGFNVVSSIFIILLLVLYTVFTFALINFGLFKINPYYYEFSNMPSFFTFFYYSFNVLLFNQIQELISITAVSQIASMVESFYALFLVAIFISLVFSVRSQRVTDDLNAVIKQLMEQGVQIEGFIRDKYKLNSIEDAMEALRTLKSLIIDTLYSLTE